MTTINSGVLDNFNPALNDQQNESQIDQTLCLASRIESSAELQPLLSSICNSYIKLQTESSYAKAYKVAKLNEKNNEEIYQVYTSIILESCMRLKTASTIKLAEKIYNENFAWLKYLNPKMTNPSDLIIQNQQIHSNLAAKVENISQMSEDEIKDLIFNRIEASDTTKLNEYLSQLDSAQKSKLFSSLMQYKTEWENDLEKINPLQHACLLGNIEVVKVLLDHGAPVNDADRMENLYTQRASLHCALDAGHSNVALLLLEKGATDFLASCIRLHGFTDYRLPAESGRQWTCITGLHMAIVKNMPEVVEKLLTVGKAKISERASGSISCLHLAAREGNEAMVTLLLSQGAKALLGSKDSQGKTPMDLAIAAKYENLIKLLTP